jgi:hypothetical protein
MPLVEEAQRVPLVHAWTVVGDTMITTVGVGGGAVPGLAYLATRDGDGDGSFAVGVLIGFALLLVWAACALVRKLAAWFYDWWKWGA